MLSMGKNKIGMLSSRNNKIGKVLFICFALAIFVTLFNLEISAIFLTERIDQFLKTNESQLRTGLDENNISYRYNKNTEWIEIASKAFSFYGDTTCLKNERKTGLTELLRKWNQLSKKHNIRYVLAYGSLLGAWRNEDLIPYDLDIDIYIIEESTLILEQIKDKRDFNNERDDDFHLVLQDDRDQPCQMFYRKLLSCNGTLVQKQIDQCSFDTPVARFFKQDLHIDIFELKTEINYNIFSKQSQKSITFYPAYSLLTSARDSKYNVELKDYCYKKLYQYEDMFPAKHCRFMGLNTRCPFNTEKVLRIMFSDDDLYPSKICLKGSWVDKSILLPRAAVAHTR